jgi:hypothetical protein
MRVPHDAVDEAVDVVGVADVQVVEGVHVPLLGAGDRAGEERFALRRLGIRDANEAARP